MPLQSSEHILLDSFYEFYEEFAFIKKVILEGSVAKLFPQDHVPETITLENSAEVIQKRLLHFLRQQKSDVHARFTQHEITSFQRVQYLMAALADEILTLDLEWSGKNVWCDYFIEEALFGSTVSGCQFFVHCDELLKQQKSDQLIIDLATIFLLSLRLGFQGMHRGSQGEAMLTQYGLKLLQFIDADSLSANGNASVKPLFYSCYQQRMTEPGQPRLASLAPWLQTAAVMLVLYLLTSHVLWTMTLSPLQALIIQGSI